MADIKIDTRGFYYYVLQSGGRPRSPTMTEIIDKLVVEDRPVLRQKDEKGRKRSFIPTKLSEK